LNNQGSFKWQSCDCNIRNKIQKPKKLNSKENVANIETVQADFANKKTQFAKYFGLLTYQICWPYGETRNRQA
jgi:hypothetical protein